MRWSTAAKYLGGLLLAALLLRWVLRSADPHEVWQSLRRASLVGLTCGALIGFSQVVFRVWRWRALLEPVRRGLPFRPMFVAVVLGYAVSWVVPGRLGEVVRPALLSARERLPFGPCFGSVVADRVLDGIAVLVLFAIGITLTPLEGEALAHAADIRKWSLVFVLAMTVPIIVLLLLSANRERVERWSSGAGRLRQWLGGVLLSLSRGIEALHHPALIVRVIVHSAGAWLLITGGTWLAIYSCGAEIPFTGLLVILPLLVLGIALPTPGGAGGYNAALMFGLTRLFAVDEAVAAGTALLVWVAVIVPVVLAGGLLLLTERIPVRELMRLGRREVEVSPT